MKNFILVVVVMFVFSFANAQKAKFGVTAGVDFATERLSELGYSGSLSETGFYVGTFVDIIASKKVHVQPELVLVFFKDSKQLQLPILAKFFVAEKLSLLLGPDVLYNLHDKIAGKKTVDFGVDFGGVYDINRNFSLEAKYNLGLTNFIKNAPSGVSGKISGLFVGLGYKF